MIFILDNDPKLCAQYLDDKSLDKMIKDIAQVLCNVHWFSAANHDVDCSGCTYGNVDECSYQCLLVPKIPLNPKNFTNEWTTWAKECKANYLYLVELGLECCSEKNIRNKLRLGFFREWLILNWARDNVPDLLILNGWESKILNGEMTQVPLVMPKKYQENTPKNRYGTTKLTLWDKHEPIHAYRNYYQAKLEQKIRQFNCGKHCDKCLRDKLAGWNDFGSLCRCQDCQCSDCVYWTNRFKPEWVTL